MYQCTIHSYRPTNESLLTSISVGHICLSQSFHDPLQFVLEKAQAANPTTFDNLASRAFVTLHRPLSDARADVYVQPRERRDLQKLFRAWFTRKGSLMVSPIMANT